LVGRAEETGEVARVADSAAVRVEVARVAAPEAVRVEVARVAVSEAMVETAVTVETVVLVAVAKAFHRAIQPFLSHVRPLLS